MRKTFLTFFSVVTIVILSSCRDNLLEGTTEGRGDGEYSSDTIESPEGELLVPAKETNPENEVLVPAREIEAENKQ